MISDIEHFFHVPVRHLNIFFGKMSIQVFCPFLNWVLGFLILSFMRCLLILDINHLSVIAYANIFFACRLSFHFVRGFLCCAKALKFN